MTSSIYTLSKRQISICSKILNQLVIQYDDYLKVRDILNTHLHIENKSPREINQLYNLNYRDFGGVIKYHFNIRLKSLKEAQQNTARQKSINYDFKAKYWKECSFSFDVFLFPNIPGYELLKEYSFSRPQEKDPNYVYLHRDHMVSIKYGYENHIPSHHISHPANCAILLEKDNIIKGSNSSITYQDLLERINHWDSKPIVLSTADIKVPRSTLHCANISKSLKGIARPERRGKKHNYPSSRKSRLK